MEVSVDRTGPCEARVSFTVPRAEFLEEVQRQIRTAGKNVRMKGFRPGKVPAPVLAKHFGPEARQRTVQHYFDQAFQRAVKEQELDTIGYERIPMDSVEVPDDADFAQSFEVSLRPVVELGEFEGLRIESELEPVMDQEIEAALADLRRRRARPEPAGDEGLPEEGMTLCKIVWTHDGEVVLERDGLRISPFDPLPGAEQEAFRKAILGAKDGQSVELDIVIPEDFEREELRGQAARCRIEVQEAFRMVPPTDEEIRALFEVDTDEALQKTVRERIAEAKEERERQRVETALLERVLDQHTLELPRRMIDAQIQARLHNLGQEMKNQGLADDAVAPEVEKHREEVARLSEKSVKAYFLVQSIAQKAGLKVENQDLVDELKLIAERHNTTFDKVRDFYREKGLVEQVAIELLERKVRRHLREKAEIVEPS